MVMFLTMVGTGIIMALLGVPLFKRMVPPNLVYGLRVTATFKDKEVWYEANARSGRDFIIGGIAIAAVAFLVFVSGIPENVGAWIDVGFLLIAVLAIGFNGWRFANQLSRQRGHDGDAV